jgi:hypothetical protein
MTALFLRRASAATLFALLAATNACSSDSKDAHLAGSAGVAGHAATAGNGGVGGRATDVAGSGGTHVQGGNGAAPGGNGSGGRTATGGRAAGGGNANHGGSARSGGSAVSEAGNPGEAGAAGAGTGGAAETSLLLLHVSPSKRYLLDGNEQPFYLIGDTAWAIVAGLTPAEADSYFAMRASQGFNAVLMDADVQLAASPVGAPERGPADADGNQPFNGKLASADTFDVSTVPAAGDTSSSAARYWQNVDAIITAAGKHGIQIILDVYDNYNPWFGGGSSPNSTDQLKAYGRFLGQRYAAFDNIIWMLGNDYNESSGGDANLAAVIQGIRQFDTRHLGWAMDEFGATFDNTGLKSNLQLDTVYEYSAGPWRSLYLSQYNRPDFGPIINIESGYENNTALGVSLADVRNEHYSFLLNGATGDTYGNEFVWPFMTSWQDWQAALSSPGAGELSYFANLVASFDWWDLIPDQDGKIFSGIGTDTDYSGAYTADGKLALAYRPANGAGSQSFVVNLDAFAGSVTARWYDPTAGSDMSIGTFDNSGMHTFAAPEMNDAGDNDFVLLLQAP